MLPVKKEEGKVATFGDKGIRVERKTVAVLKQRKARPAKKVYTPRGGEGPRMRARNGL